MPLLGSMQGYAGGPATIAVTGIPANSTGIVVTWWNGDTGFDEAFSTWGSYGRPSEYFIEASPNGSSWTALTHVTGNSYNGRQFFYDTTATGYTQVRLRVVSIVGANGGNVVVTAHAAPNNTADTYLLLGDSITSNCWAAAPNTFPTEAFGLGVHAQIPSRFPVVTEAGIPAQDSGSVLSKAPYGIPAVRKWLQDFPSVKYVGLSYGTNDANGNMSPATYYANMKNLVQEVIAAGKTPIIPTIVASPSTNVQANAPGLNSQLVTLESQYPSIIRGPDLWNLFQGHSVNDGWFFDDLHPSLTTGCTALQNAWVNTMISTVYPH